MNLLWSFFVVYIAGSAIYALGGFVALVIAICALVVWSLAANYPSWVLNRCSIGIGDERITARKD